MKNSSGLIYLKKEVILFTYSNELISVSQFSSKYSNGGRSIIFELLGGGGGGGGGGIT